MKVRFVCPSIVLAAMFAVSLHASSKPVVPSGPLDGTIVVDGDESDWTGVLQPFGDAPFSLQAVNDGHDLYLRLSASSPDVRREITRFGLTVWFDPAGGSKKGFGIRYPVVQEPYDQYQGQGRGGGHEGGHHETPQTPPEGADQPSGDSESHDRVDILGPGKNDARSLTRDHLEGVAVAMKVVQGAIAYELKVPLATDDGHPYAIGTSPGKTIGIGFETPKVNPPSMSRGGGGFGGGGGGFGGGGYGGGHGGGGGGGYGGHRGGGAGGRGGHQGGEQPKALKAWGTLTLHQ